MLLNYMTEHALGTLGLCILETFLSFLFKIMNVYLGLQLYSSSAQCTFTQATDRPTVKSDLFVEKQYGLDIKEWQTYFSNRCQKKNQKQTSKTMYT